MAEKMQENKQCIEAGLAILGMELGSTRIKAVLINQSNEVLASGVYEWENCYVDGFWSYALEQVWQGVASSYAQLKQSVQEKYGVELQTIQCMGVSAMMHGYLAFDKTGQLLVPFRTWRNTTTHRASTQLTQLFQHTIPQRWSIAHLYQAVLEQESHLGELDFITTLAGYVHWQLTGEKVIGLGDASGMFPIDTKESDYNATFVEQFNQLLQGSKLTKALPALLPKVLAAGAKAGVLSQAGARLLDPSGALQAGVLFCPPEGDASTGMVATHSIAPLTGNVSAGTSVFAMVVLERPLSKLYPEIDVVCTPSGQSVAMVHCNNCTSDINDWVELFVEFAQQMGLSVNKQVAFEKLYTAALLGDATCGGLMSCNYVSGEHLVGIAEGRPLLVRKANSKLNLANFMKTHLYSAVATLKIGMDILKSDGIKISTMMGHGGFFKTAQVGQQVMAAALDTPVAVMPSVGEDGAWGMAILASYGVNKGQNESLETYLLQKVFQHATVNKVTPSIESVNEYQAYMKEYEKLLKIEKLAADTL
jgi:sugar (pentulose or hexulose) kinase